ncbi:MAG: aminotransferase class I/II-fold pyridoxal phosphate-dependent enzyme [Lachnospiraceae bacterium]|nr:aminotransferase class I/II-fold pyridoxal phosphate-dependent enzyme [Lachnospiraceae bacterium]
MEVIHGGDIYRNRVIHDFSVNINPLGVPKRVRESLERALDDCEHYPDPLAEKLRKALAEKDGVKPDQMVFGNGASELFFGISHALRPGKVVIPVPSFSEYEVSARAVGADVVYFQLLRERDFALDERIFSCLAEDVDLLYLANPNNPNGRLTDRDLLCSILQFCLERRIRVMLDECFIELTDAADAAGMLSELESYPNLILVRAFTKTYAIPGVRLGYLYCSDPEVVRSLESHLPAWNLSVFAEVAGVAACTETAYVEQAVRLIGQERALCRQALSDMGFEVFGSDVNFLLFRAGGPLDELLLKEGILIRSCAGYAGLAPGYFRMAVKLPEENRMLMETIARLSANKCIPQKNERNVK